MSVVGDPRESGALAEAERLLACGRPREAGVLLIEAAEKALADGDPERARALCDRATDINITDGVTTRLAAVLAQANRFLNRHGDTLTWIERRLAGPHEPATHAVLLQARIAALRQLDVRAVLDLADEAMAAADAVGNEEAYANVVSHAAFAAYRRGDVRTAERYAAAARSHAFVSTRAAIDGLRAQLFASIAKDSLETSLSLSRQVCERAQAAGNLAAAANEHRNIAETLLRLGLPEAARGEAQRCAELAQQAGHRGNEWFARVLMGIAAAETGDLDAGIDELRRAGVDTNPMDAADAASALAFFLVERGHKEDAAEACEIAGGAADRVARAGISHCMTRIHATHARALYRLGQTRQARDALGRARSLADVADAEAAHHLALTMAEVLPPEDPARRVAVNAARVRLLRNAGKREDPHAYCTRVRLHRRLLELSGGVPADLPGGR